MSQQNKHPIERAIEEIRQGRMIILVDAEDRENEGDIVIAAEFADARAVNFMATHAKGLICVPLTVERAKRLELTPMVEENSALHATAFTVSVDAKHGTTTGISAMDRAETIRCLVDLNTRPSDLLRPGHIFPLLSAPGGVLERPGHTEAAVELATLAGLSPVAVICEMLAKDGSMAKLPELKGFAEAKGLNVYYVSDLLDYLRRPSSSAGRYAKDATVQAPATECVAQSCPST